MQVLFFITFAVCLIATAVHIITTITVIARLRRNRIAPPLMNVGVSIIRPVCGIENFSLETLRSAFSLDYPCYEVIFCAASASDPIVPLVQRLIELHPGIPARLLIGNDRVSDNPKLNNVVKGWMAARHSWIVMADSNVLMPPDYVHRLLGTWCADTGLVSSPAIGCWPRGFWAEVECGFLNTYQARWQCFIDSTGCGFAQGKSMLYRKEVLEAAGGIGGLAGEPAEDAASTKLVRNQGLRVRVIDRPFSQPLGSRSATEVWSRQIRWARLRRDTFFTYFIPEVFAGALIPVAAFGFVAGSSHWPMAASLIAFLAHWYGWEAALAAAAGWHLSWASPIAWLFRDLLLPVLWIASWRGNDIIWRDTPIRLAGASPRRECHMLATEISEQARMIAAKAAGDA